MSFCIADYMTGLDLETKNQFSVIVKSSDEHDEKAVLTASDGKKIYNWHRIWTVSVDIDYPADYMDMCIGVCGSCYAPTGETEKNFWNGKVPFSKTVCYSPTNPEIAHFMRVDPSEAKEAE